MIIMKKIAIGILAHVDSGKTTLSESLLYNSGAISKPGRVDHGDAFLDTDTLEKERGITIFSKQAVFEYGGSHITLLDTPGHADFSAEAERTLKVLDYAILAISGSDGVQSHTKTLWKLLEHYRVPVFVFINKMDLAASDRQKIKTELQKSLSSCCIDFSDKNEAVENIATADNELMEEFFDSGAVSKNSVCRAVAQRKIFPCCFGSALKNEGIKELLDIIDAYTLPPQPKKDFGAKVFKISEDEKGSRLAHLKITGGTLAVRDLITAENGSGKVNEIRIYSGAKYKNVKTADAGTVCAVTGLSFAYAGQGLGTENDFNTLVSEAVFTYSVKLPDGYDINKALNIFKKLSGEETQMNVSFNEQQKKINIQIMGSVQLEVLKRILSDRFNLDAEFENGGIIYKETIENEVEGVGHFEPLRHYAEVHLKMEPAEKGSGITIASECSEDELDKNYQNLIMAHIAEKTHLGVLTGSHITDIKITLVSGKAHVKHTEGGDFREATYRAIRQGLMQAKSVVLEPWYRFTLEIPVECTGRALTDLEQLGANTEPPETSENISVISGTVPVGKMNEYHEKLISYTHGSCRLSCFFNGYGPCVNQQEVIEKIGYDCEADIQNTADSVFCSHGSGITVKWDDVFNHMHLPLKKKKISEPAVPAAKYRALIADEEELLKIFEATYGKIKNKSPRPLKTPKTPVYQNGKAKIFDETYLLIDGYNIIFAWDELKEIAKDSLDSARSLLINKICNYRAMRNENVILVFDAYKVPGSYRETENLHGVSVVYTKEAETADSYIEKTSKVLSKNYRVRVATSDNLEQIIIFGNGAYRISAPEFEKDVQSAEDEMRKYIEKQ